MSRRIEEILEADRKAMLAEFDRDLPVPHPGTKGDIREDILIRFLEKQLHGRYGVCTGLVVNAHDEWSKQQDVIVYDRANSSLAGDRGQRGKIILVESVQATIEVKSTLRAQDLRDIGLKAESVRRLAEKSNFLEQSGSQGSSGILSAGFAFRSDVSLKRLRQKLTENRPRADMLCVLSDPGGHSGFFSRIRKLG